MSKDRSPGKESKKKAVLSLKEKRAAKKAKKGGTQSPFLAPQK